MEGADGFGAVGCDGCTQNGPGGGDRVCAEVVDLRRLGTGGCGAESCDISIADAAAVCGYGAEGVGSGRLQGGNAGGQGGVGCAGAHGGPGGCLIEQVVGAIDEAGEGGGSIGIDHGIERGVGGGDGCGGQGADGRGWCARGGADKHIINADAITVVGKAAEADLIGGGGVGQWQRAFGPAGDIVCIACELRPIIGGGGAVINGQFILIELPAILTVPEHQLGIICFGAEVNGPGNEIAVFIGGFAVGIGKDGVVAAGMGRWGFAG